MFGKVLGAMVGVAVGLLLQSGPLAALLACIGIVIGHLLFDRAADEPSPEKLKSIDELLSQPARAQAPRPVPRSNPDTLVAKLLCPIFVEVARSDGPVTQPEVRIIREYFREERKFDEDSLELVRQQLKTALAGSPVELSNATTKARKQLTPAERPLFVNALYELALVDGELKRAESDAIRQVVSALNLSEEQLQQITSMHLGSGLQHYEVLGLSDGASDDELRTAFRKLAAESHPDRFAGRPKREVEAAAERFRRVTDAWAELRKLRGL